MKDLPKTQLNLRRLDRRTGGIQGLAEQYRKQVEQLSSQYQSSFAQYQQGVSERMADYQSRMSEYNSALEQYTANVVAPYNKAVETFRSNIDAFFNEQEQIDSGARDRRATGRDVTYTKNRTQYVDYRVTDPVTGREFSLYGENSDLVRNPEKYGYESVEIGGRGKNVYIFRPLPSTPKPTAPEKPSAFTQVKPESPAIQEFDKSGFEAQKTELSNAFQREVGERRAARLGAVSRRSTRPMLQGA